MLGVGVGVAAGGCTARPVTGLPFRSGAADDGVVGCLTDIWDKFFADGCSEDGVNWTAVLEDLKLYRGLGDGVLGSTSCVALRAAIAFPSALLMDMNE